VVVVGAGVGCAKPMEAATVARREGDGAEAVRGQVGFRGGQTREKAEWK
jgi:hypothetical protein